MAKLVVLITCLIVGSTLMFLAARGKQRANGIASPSDKKRWQTGVFVLTAALAFALMDRAMVWLR